MKKIYFSTVQTLLGPYQLKKNEKSGKKFSSFFAPGGAPKGPHISAQGRNFKKRLDELIYIVSWVIHKKIYPNRPSSSLRVSAGSGNKAEHFII